MNRPVLYWGILFVLGVVLCRVLPIGLTGIIVVGVIIGGFISARLVKKNQLIIFLGSVFFILGASRYIYIQKCMEYCRALDREAVSFDGRVEKLEVSDKGSRYIVNSFTINGENMRIHIVLETTEEIGLGSVVTGTGEIKSFLKASNPGGYDEESYQYGKGIFLSLQNVTIHQENAAAIPFRSGLYRLKNRIAGIYDKVFEEKSASLAKAMVLGDQEGLDSDIKRLYQKNGIAHLIAISGLHIAMIGGVLYQTLRKLLGSYFVSAGFGVCFILSYGMMTGFSGSTVRAVMMLTVSIGADVWGRRYDMVTAVAASLFFMLMVNPCQITQVGFLLSFGAVIGIAVVNPVWKQIFPHLPQFFDGLEVSISVQITLFPILLYYFYEIPLYGIFLNVIVIPVMSLLLALLVLAGIAGCFLLESAYWFAKPAQIIFMLYEQLCIWCEGLPFHTVCIGRPSVIWIAVYYSILAVALLAVYKKKRKIVFILGITFCLLSFFFYIPGNLKICMFDVGQGDGIYIRTPDRKHILVDGGSSSKQKVGNYVLKNGIRFYGGAALDYVFVSHSDSDHYSGILELLEDDEISIENFVLPAITNPDKAFHTLEQKAQDKGCHIYYMKRGDTLSIGDVAFYCLNPQKRRYEDKNQGSIVLWMKYRNFDMLFTGDMDGEIEDEITNYAAGRLEVLKVAHHGSATASTEKFLKNFSPDTACISVGAGNSYGHPAGDVMKRLEQYCRNIYLTKDNGAVTIDTNGKEYWIEPYLKE